jgi:hypothetical protein
VPWRKGPDRKAGGLAPGAFVRSHSPSPLACGFLPVHRQMRLGGLRRAVRRRSYLARAVRKAGPSLCLDTRSSNPGIRDWREPTDLCRSNSWRMKSAGAAGISANAFETRSVLAHIGRPYVRLERACRLIADKRPSLAHAAIAYGYYDQAHMTPEWSALAGCSQRRGSRESSHFCRNMSWGERDNEPDDSRSLHQSLV